MKKHNFYAGPSILPQYTIENTAKAVIDFAGTGLSILEISHRSKEFVAVMEETVTLFKELLDIPEGYHVVFVGGGASTQFFTVPYNLMKSRAAYLDTGEWASKAIKEAKLFGDVVVVGSSKDKNYTYIPKGYDVPSDVDYFHFTSNNTIYGTEILNDFDLNVPVVSDMSSDIFSRTLDVSKYALIYGGAQKNLAPAGVTFAIVREDVLGKVDRAIPSMVNYKTHIDKESMFNTPPVVVVYSALQTLKWLKQEGGVAEMEKRNKEKANLLYGEIDKNRLFVGTVAKEDRSRMNVGFVMAEGYGDLEKPFLDFTTQNGIVGLKGHRSVGGFRASLYNALPLESVKHLVSCMQQFEKDN